MRNSKNVIYFFSFMTSKISTRFAPENGSSKKVKQKKETPRDQISAFLPLYPSLLFSLLKASGGIKK